MTRYLIGIDLGTTHTVVAYADTAQPDAPVSLFPVPQLVAPGEVAGRPLLPSVCYLHGPGELDDADVRLPWASPFVDGDNGRYGVVIGQLARELGQKTPGRLVTSAKSWLSHDRVDRQASILPWGDVGDVPKISPVQASAWYLAHVRSAWNHQFPDFPLERQTLVITVPASFDEGARALTLEAARLSGLGKLRLLEEPQAACYDWLASHGQLPAESRLLLVCDVGGGTTDLTLIRVDRGQAQPQLTRIGVGNHLMLGGDNIDLALAHQVERSLGTERLDSGRLSYGRLSQLLEQTRVVKEALLGAEAPVSRKVTVLGGGSKLLAGARSVELQRQQVRDLVLEGYFPPVELVAAPRKRRSAVVEFGLPYEAEAAISRHIADFILGHQRAMAEALGADAPSAGAIVPDSLLLNGGVFNAGPIRQRLLTQLQCWRGGDIAELTGIDPNLAVARGAVFFSLAQRGRGRKIGGGSARSYYLKLQVQDKNRETVEQLVCLLPRGTPEGQPQPLADRDFGLLLGDPVRFDLVASTGDSLDNAGDLVTLEDNDDLVALPPLATVLAAGAVGAPRPGSRRHEVRVQLEAELTEVGTLAVTCIDRDSGQRWLLDFNLRGAGSRAPATVSAPQPGMDAPTPAAERHPKLDQALARIERAYGKAVSKPDPRDIKGLRTDLEKILGSRNDWDMALCRELFNVLLQSRRERKRSADHERQWLNLAGFCLRPGYGADLDDWRMVQLEKLHQQGVIHQEPQIWAEWWTLWRRVAGGLSDDMQGKLYKNISHYLHPSVAQSRARMAELQKRAYSEMVRLLGALEGLDVEQKREAGQWLLKRLEKSSESEQTWWAVGRLGSRIPFYGNAHKTLPAATAQSWLDVILAKNWHKSRTAAFAATLIARHSGDRELDVSPEYQALVLDKLKATKCPTSWQQMVSERVELDQEDTRRIFGEALPQGIRLLR